MYTVKAYFKVFGQMSQDILDELQFFLLVFNFHIRGFDIHGTLVARINRIYGGLPVLSISINLGRMSVLEHVAFMGQINLNIILLGKPKRKDHFGDQEVDG
jgi:hypothetical protein